MPGATSDAHNAALLAHARVSSLPRQCLACGAAGVANRCGGCRRVFFCDRECQKRAWAAHRDDCQSAATVQQVSSPVRIPRSEAAVTEIKEEENEEDEDEVKQPEAAKPAVTHAKKKKSKGKHKRKKTRSMSLHVPSGGPADANDDNNASQSMKPRSASLGARKHVMWGQVTAREFSRFPGGGGAVPYDGTWALGLGQRVADVQLGSVVEVEELRAEELKARAQELPRTQRPLVREGETRQFDYRRGVDNPLFARLSERERKQLFTTEREQRLSMSPPKELHFHGHASRRKQSVASSSGYSDPEEDGDGGEDTPDFACISIEQLDEFARIRDSRDAACGCSCGDLVRRVAKMSAKKLSGFLRDRGVDAREVHALSRPELVKRAKQLAKLEKNCQTQDGECECARNGVPCHEDACEGCAGDCFNPFNCYEYKRAEVRAYRKQRLEQWRAQTGLLDAERLQQPSVPVA